MCTSHMTSTTHTYYAGYYTIARYETSFFIFKAIPSKLTKLLCSVERLQVLMFHSHFKHWSAESDFQQTSASIYIIASIIRN